VTIFHTQTGTDYVEGRGKQYSWRRDQNTENGAGSHVQNRTPITAGLNTSRPKPSASGLKRKKR